MQLQNNLKIDTRSRSLLAFCLCLLASVLWLVPAVAQETEAASSTTVATNAESPPELSAEQQAEVIEQHEKELAAIEQLREIQDSLNAKLEERKALRRELKQAADDVKDSLNAKLEALNSELELLEKTFEQIAIGGVDLEVFGEKDKKFDWREELVLIVQPLIENVKSLTEKPRQIEALRRVIQDNRTAAAAATKALESIGQLLEEAESKAVGKKLLEIQGDWQSQLEDLQRKIQLAEFQLSSLEGKNVRWLDVVKSSLYDFATGRGLTLLLVLIVSLAIWALMAGFLWLFKVRSKDSEDRSTKTHYRLAAYGYRALTILLIAIGIMSVLYLRQDLLLLAIVVIILFGLALAFKNLLPRYVAEGRLLLNLGSVRERELVIYNGIPWRVASINMYCRFTNPQISGSLRVPIAELHDLISRTARITDSWFPSSAGDWVLDDDNTPLNVVNQGVDTVELRDLDRVSHFIPTADYYAAGYRNLSSGESFRVKQRFGIDYQLQALDVVEVAAEFKAGIERNFSSAPFADDVQEVRVEFHSAGDSSLNYNMYAIMNPVAAPHHNRIQRRIQAACVTVCNEQDWGIPFPHVTVHQFAGNNSEKSAAE